jgi:hypothetical protein
MAYTNEFKKFHAFLSEHECHSDDERNFCELMKMIVGKFLARTVAEAGAQPVEASE